MRLDQDRIYVKSDFNGRVSIRCSGKASMGDQVEGEVADIEGRGTYNRNQVEGGADLTPPSLTTWGLRSGLFQGRAY